MYKMWNQNWTTSSVVFSVVILVGRVEKGCKLPNFFCSLYVWHDCWFFFFDEAVRLLKRETEELKIFQGDILFTSCLLNKALTIVRWPLLLHLYFPMVVFWLPVHKNGRMPKSNALDWNARVKTWRCELVGQPWEFFF